MADRRRYFCYVIANTNENIPSKFIIKFPDFPELEVFANQDALDPYGGITIEQCCSRIIDSIADRLVQGLEAPRPQTPLSYSPKIEIEVDIDLIKVSVCRSKFVNKPN